MHLRTIEERLTRDHDLPGDFVFFRWECFPKSEPTLYVEFQGARCPLLTRGKRKGRPNYRKATEKQTFIVTVAEADRWESEYEETTGNCRECRGDRRVVARIDFVNGTKDYRACVSCKGTGKGQEALG